MRNWRLTLLFVTCAAMGPASYAHAGTPLTDLTVLYSLTRLYYTQAKKVIPFMHSRVENFLIQGGEIQFERNSNPSPHYQKMMHELMTSYDLLQKSKPYLSGALFSRLSGEWQFIHDQLNLSLKYYRTNKSVSSQYLALALREAEKSNFVLKSLDVIL